MKKLGLKCLLMKFSLPLLKAVSVCCNPRKHLAKTRPLAKSMRAAERLLGTSTAYLEKKLKLKVNTEKSRAVSVYSIRNFGFSALRWEGTERVHISEFTQSRRRKPKINSEN